MSQKQESPPVCDVVTVDYIRLATWDWQLYLDLAARIRRKWVGWRKTRWLQYAMETHDNVISYGCAVQRDKGHGVIQASGVDAHILFTWLANTLTDSEKSALYGTRFDLQCTKPRHPDIDYIKLHKKLRDPKELRINPQGSTLYIGNRESETYWRLYDKTEQHVRLEVECKGKQAKAAWLFCSFKPREIANLYSSHIQKSRVPSLVAHIYQSNIVPAKDDDLQTEWAVDLETKFLWLAKLDGLVYKLANDHDMHDRMVELVGRWFDYTTKD
jgi:hypothetical protein